MHHLLIGPYPIRYVSATRNDLIVRSEQKCTKSVEDKGAFDTFLLWLFLIIVGAIHDNLWPREHTNKAAEGGNTCFMRAYYHTSESLQQASQETSSRAATCTPTNAARGTRK
jgi:hypothetical protein